MRSSNKSRSRNKPGGHNNHNNQRRNVGGNVMNRVFDSAGPDGKVRGTPQQIIDKYNVLARDAQLSGDRVAAESFLQHSEHYTRLLSEAMRQQQEQRQAQEQQREEQQQRENKRREEAQARQKAEQAEQPRPQVQPESESSGLTTIEATESRNENGPVETPENQPAAVQDDAVAAPVEESTEAPVAKTETGDPAPVAAADSVPAPKPKRPRARRKPKAEKTDETPAA